MMIRLIIITRKVKITSIKIKKRVKDHVFFYNTKNDKYQKFYNIKKKAQLSFTPKNVLNRVIYVAIMRIHVQ